MGVAEDEGSKFHDRNETRKIEDLGVRVATIDDSGKIEEFRALVYFCPEAFFEGLFSCFQGGGFFDEVEVGEIADDFRETMRLKDIQKFKRFLKENSGKRDQNCGK